MRVSFTVSLWLAAGLFHPVAMSFYDLDNSEGSGYDLEFSGSGSGSGPGPGPGSGSGSGDWSEEGGVENDYDLSKSVRMSPVNTERGTTSVVNDSLGLTFDKNQPIAVDEIIVVANSKSLVERREVFAAIVAGGIMGGLLAATLASVLIYKWRIKGNDGYILGKQRAPDEY